MSLRNPRTVPQDELLSRDVALDSDGKPIDMQEASASMRRTFARLIVGWRVYDASFAEVDSDTGEPLDQPLLPMPATPELVNKLPTVITNRITQEFGAAINPP